MNLVSVPIISILMLITTVINGQQVNCSQFRTGKFELIDKEHNVSYLIERNDSVQIEKNLTSGSTSTYKVYWISDCEYDLEMKSGNPQALKFYNGKRLHIKIIELYSDGYKFSSSVEGYEKTMYQIIKSVKN